MYVCMYVYRVIKKTLCTWRSQSPQNCWFEDGHHRIHSECGRCCTENGVQEHSSACQWMSGDWRGTLWTLLLTFCIVIVRCTETFWSPCINWTLLPNWMPKTDIGSTVLRTTSVGCRKFIFPTFRYNPVSTFCRLVKLGRRRKYPTLKSAPETRRRFFFFYEDSDADIEAGANAAVL